MTDKKQLGQFYSTNADKLLKDFKIPECVVEPFIGNGDLIKWAIKNGLKRYSAFDIDPPDKLKYKCIKRDTLRDPPKYKDKFVLTNPPYLAKNKSTDKDSYGDYDDLYKLFIHQLIEGKAQGGIVIIPLNFLCGTRSSDILLRDELLSNYLIKQINIFLKPAFNDTTYTVCSIWFEKSKIVLTNQHIKIWWHDEQEYTTVNISQEHDWLLGGEIVKYCKSDDSEFSVSRLTDKTDETKCQISHIRLHGLDTRDTKIHLEYNEEPYVGKQTDRMFATLIFCGFNRKITIKEQKKIIDDFNKLLNSYRDKYKSMFLTNYRDFGRKRIGFDMVYNMVEYLMEQLGIN